MRQVDIAVATHQGEVVLSMVNKSSGYGRGREAVHVMLDRDTATQIRDDLDKALRSIP